MKRRARVMSGSKGPTRKRVCQNGEADPRAHFRAVVRTRYELEQGSHGNGTFLRAVRLSHATELNMNGSVDALANTHSDQCREEHRLVGHRRVKRMTQRVSNLEMKHDEGDDEESEAPVIGAVLEQVGERHRAVRELVDKEGLEETLRVMECPRNHCGSAG